MKTLTRIAAVTLATALMTAVGDGGVAEAHDTERTWRACKQEDGSGQRRCVWDAKHQGNGTGHSIKVFHGGTEKQRVVRITHRRAHHLLEEHHA